MLPALTDNTDINTPNMKQQQTDTQTATQQHHVGFSLRDNSAAANSSPSLAYPQQPNNLLPRGDEAYRHYNTANKVKNFQAPVTENSVGFEQCHLCLV
jgi:hypothetical protein